MLKEMAQQAQFVGAQGQQPAAKPGLVGRPIQHQIAMNQTSARNCRCLRLGFISREPFEQAFGIERPDEVVVGPGAQGAAFIIRLGTFEHHRDMAVTRRACFAQGADHLKT